ncbi:hypothetical protein HID58_009176 [Brassica napus]|uniref:Uncharacterized protein n=1 Tax=Brassica napus TaxID=3708 RepID=A0ABQ8DRS1_BRANA|nr:hypothetical protein HID58_009176 [Brassica napus]
MRLIPLQGGVSTPIKEFWEARNFKHGGELTMVMLRWSRNLFFSNINPFEEKGLADEWDKVGMYLSGNVKKVYEDLYKEMTQLLTRDHFRE